MFLRKFLIILRRTIRHSRLIQAGLLAGFWALGEIVAHATQIPVPGSVLGLFLVLALLACGRLQAIHLRRGANWLLADMLLFFVPAVLAVLDHPEFMGFMGLKLLVAVVAGTLLVMSATALCVEFYCRRAFHDAE